MQIRRNHWLKALTLAITLHAAMLIGLRSRTVGEASPAEGPIIELVTAVPGVIGAMAEDVKVQSPDEVEELREPDKTDVKEPVELKPEPVEPDVQKPEPIVTEAEPQKTEPAITESEPTKTEPVKAEPEQQITESVNTVLTTPKTEPIITERKPEITKKKQKPKPKTVQKKKRPKTAQKPKKKRPKTTRKKTKKRAVASKRGNARKGSAGARKGGGGRSKANAGAVNRYASLVRARILSRRPSSSGNRGTTVIVFQLSASGGLRWARIRRSSGNGNLDRKALGSVRRAAPFPHPPAGMRTRQLRFSIPFRFR